MRKLVTKKGQSAKTSRNRVYIYMLRAKCENPKNCPVLAPFRTSQVPKLPPLTNGFLPKSSRLNFNPMKEFGLVLFVFTIGLQLGPGFFASLRAEGMRLNVLAAVLVLLAGILRRSWAGWSAWTKPPWRDCSPELPRIRPRSAPCSNRWPRCPGSMTSGSHCRHWPAPSPIRPRSRACLRRWCCSRSCFASTPRKKRKPKPPRGVRQPCLSCDGRSSSRRRSWRA